MTIEAQRQHGMQRMVAEFEGIGAANFVLLIGLVAGVLRGMPRFFLDEGSMHGQPVLLLVVGVGAVIWLTAAVLLWRIAVRRRQSSLWTTAAQVTLGLVIADLLATALGLVAASFDTHGELAALISTRLGDVIVSNLVLALFRAPLWLVGSIVAIAPGRQLDATLRTQRP